MIRIKKTALPAKNGKPDPGKIGMAVAFTKLQDLTGELSCFQTGGSIELKQPDPGGQPVKVKGSETDMAFFHQHGLEESIRVAESTVLCSHDGFTGRQQASIKIDPARNDR